MFPVSRLTRLGTRGLAVEGRHTGIPLSEWRDTTGVGLLHLQNANGPGVPLAYPR
jgi:hypothetical protein